MSMSLCNSYADACDIMSAMSSCAALGNMVICSTDSPLPVEIKAEISHKRFIQDRILFISPAPKM